MCTLLEIAWSNRFFYSLAFLCQFMAILYIKEFAILGLIFGIIGYFGNKAVQPIQIRKTATLISKEEIMKREEKVVQRVGWTH